MLEQMKEWSWSVSPNYREDSCQIAFEGIGEGCVSWLVKNWIQSQVT